MDADSRVRLAEIGGDVKRIFDRFDNYAKEAERRDQAHAAFSDNVNTRLNSHSDRLRTLETVNANSAGEKQGVGKTLRFMYLVMGGSGGVVATGLAAIVARSKGL